MISLKIHQDKKSYFSFLKDFYRPRRKYKRKDTGAEDEKTRVRITLLEYGDKGNQTFSNSNKIMSTTKITSEEIDIERTVPVEIDPNEVRFDSIHNINI